MEGVTTAIVAFILICIVYPGLVKNKPQFYAAFACVLLIILLHSLALMLRESTGFVIFAGVFTGVFQVVGLVLLMLSAGGITIQELGSDLSNAYEVIRRGETEKEIIVPLRGEVPKPREEAPPKPEEINIPLEGGE